jgi:hypothetical protein
MKRFLSFTTICLFCILFIAISCTNKDNISVKATPGSYTVEKILQIKETEPESRGIKNANDAFDNKYDYDFIYLHVVGSNDALKLPLYTVECETNKQCLCFRYHIRVYDDGRATISLIDNEGNPSSSEKEYLDIPSGANCYFSSIENSTWELIDSGEENQIYQKSNHHLYTKNDKVNIEIYRSSLNFNIHELTESIEGLTLKRACSGFTVFGLFYNEEALENNEDPLENVELSQYDFEKIMDSYLSQWYIKVYIGGKTYVKKYNFGTMTKESDGQDDSKKGYYSTGEFISKYNNHKFQPLQYNLFGYDLYRLDTYGYLTSKKVRLLCPVIKEELEAYILIKKWEGNGEPSEEWLASDDDALYTKVDLSGYALPENDHFYCVGLLMDVRQFRMAWDKAQSSRPSRTTNGMHYFELKDAKVIVEKY